MTEPTTDKEWADYLTKVLRQLDALAQRKAQDASALSRIDPVPLSKIDPVA